MLPPNASTYQSNQGFDATMPLVAGSYQQHWNMPASRTTHIGPHNTVGQEPPSSIGETGNDHGTMNGWPSEVIATDNVHSGAVPGFGGGYDVGYANLPSGSDEASSSHTYLYEGPNT